MGLPKSKCDKELLDMINTPFAAEYFLSKYWAKFYNEAVHIPKLKNNQGWDFKAGSNNVEVKTVTAQSKGNNIYRFKIDKLANKTGSVLCSILELPDKNYSLIGFNIPSSVWQPVRTKDGQVSFNARVEDGEMIPLCRSDEALIYASYYRLVGERELNSMFDLIEERF